MFLTNIFLPMSSLKEIILSMAEKFDQGRVPSWQKSHRVSKTEVFRDAAVAHKEELEENICGDVVIRGPNIYNCGKQSHYGAFLPSRIDNRSDPVLKT